LRVLEGDLGSNFPTSVRISNFRGKLILLLPTLSRENVGLWA